MKRIYFLIICISLVATYGIFLYTQTDATISINVFEVKNGFGYTISLQNKVLIKQENIPAIQSYKPFCSSRDAQKVAILVKHKISIKESPTVSLEELKNLNIDFNCLDLH